MVKSPDHDFMVLSLDLVSSITKGMGSEVEPHLDNLIEDLSQIMQSDIYRVQKSAFALLGILLIAEIMEILDKNIESKFPSVSANAIFALGEIVVKLGIILMFSNTISWNLLSDSNIFTRKGDDEIHWLFSFS